MRKMQNWFFMLLLLPALPSWGGDLAIPEPEPKATCPVCGMFVAKYPQWVAAVVYKDGHRAYFDGPKDLFKYLLDLPKWAPGHRREEIQQIAVKEYYGLSWIPAQEAWYVVGSDVLGPMGHELIPLKTEADAKAFLQDHGGKWILRFDEVQLDLLKALDQG